MTIEILNEIYAENNFKQNKLHLHVIASGNTGIRCAFVDILLTGNAIDCFFLSCLLIWLYWIEITVFWAAKAENKSNRIEKSWKFHEVHFDEKSLTSPSLFVCFIIEMLEMSLFIKPFIHSCFPVHSISNSDKKKNIESNRQQKMNETIEREEHS